VTGEVLLAIGAPPTADLIVNRKKGLLTWNSTDHFMTEYTRCVDGELGQLQIGPADSDVTNFGYYFVRRLSCRAAHLFNEHIPWTAQYGSSHHLCGHYYSTDPNRMKI
jgi:hypothetical protein